VSVRAGIVVTGTEVLTGRVQDRNGPWLADRLFELGIDLAHISICGDRPDDMTAQLRFMASTGMDLVVTSGGLGPTADDLTMEIVTRFADPERGGFFSTAADGAALLARRKELEDHPIPAGGSSAAFGLLRLARLTGDSRWEDAAVGQLRLLHTVAPQHPNAFGHLLRALDFHLATPREVASYLVHALIPGPAPAGAGA